MLDTQVWSDMHPPPACQYYTSICSLGRQKPFILNPQPMHRVQVSRKPSAALAEPAAESSLVVEVWWKCGGGPAEDSHRERHATTLV